MEIKPVRVTGYLSPELARRARVLAAQRGWRQNDVFKEALQEYLDREENKP